MATIQDVKSGFAAAIQENSDLFRHCLSPNSLHTPSGVEAAFLQVQKKWELFLEEILISILCGGQPLNGPSVTPYFTVSDPETARVIVYQDKLYLDWVNDEKVKNRFSYFLTKPNRINGALDTVTIEMREIAKIRNYIAHSSLQAREQFEKVWQGKVGGNPAITRAAEFLLLEDRDNPPFTFFDKYLVALEVTAKSITG